MIRVRNAIEQCSVTITIIDHKHDSDSKFCEFNLTNLFFDRLKWTKEHI